MLIFILGVIVLSFCFEKNINSLRYISLISVTNVLIIIISLSILSTINLYDNYNQTGSLFPNGQIEPFSGSITDIIQYSGSICFAFSSILCLIPVYNELHTRSLFNG